MWGKLEIKHLFIIFWIMAKPLVVSSLKETIWMWIYVQRKKERKPYYVAYSYHPDYICSPKKNFQIHVKYSQSGFCLQID